MKKFLCVAVLLLTFSLPLASSSQATVENEKRESIIDIEDEPADMAVPSPTPSSSPSPSPKPEPEYGSLRINMKAGGAAFSVRETKNSMKAHTVGYYCDMFYTQDDYCAQLTADNGTQTVQGFIKPDADAGEAVPAAPVVVTIENVKIK